MAETTVLRSSAINRTPNPGAKPQAQLSGVHPVVQVNMSNGGPVQQNGQGLVRQGVVLLPPKGARRNFTTGGLPNQGAKPSVVISAPKDPRIAAAATTAATVASTMTMDQLMFLRHRASSYVDEVKTAAGEAQLDEATTNNLQLAEATIGTIDLAMEQITQAAEAAAAAAAAAAPPPPPRAVAAGRSQATVAGPRRVVRPGPPPPPVVVKMDGGVPVPDDAPATDAAQG
jgi:hypothetical protein